MTDKKGQYSIIESPCPWCGTNHDAASAPFNEDDDGTPKPGDGSMCVQCGEFSVFDPLMVRRKPTAEEAADLEADIRVQMSREAFRMYRRQYHKQREH